MEEWPSLRVEEWSPTRDTLHMWAQVVGKVRLAQAPMVNHWWQVPLYVSARGLTTSAIPYGTRVFDIEFDLCDHLLRIRAGDGRARDIGLEAMPVAVFYTETMNALHELGLDVRIMPRPTEVEPAIPFAEDYQHCSYDPGQAHLFWLQLVQAHRVLSEFRSYFIGKVSPVHLFWGAMDLACTRFSGRTAPKHPGGAPNVGDWVMVEGYTHELSSCGFFPGGGEEGAFYSYAYPEPEGYADFPVRPQAAYYSTDLGEFVLPYEAARTARDPGQAVLDFLQDTYAAAADLGHWDRESLEDDPNRRAHPH
ncbi:DUF5996 family protein [Spongiactinospora sp. 9N601]|uniref:DUF5996 family protein n=1 Tax=Spongiactinospora sp. 9N601 TaxID=3375149 RepID=UPI0037B4F482